MNYSKVLQQAGTALSAAADYAALVCDEVRSRVVVEGRAKSDLINREQRAVHGYAWIETTVTALRSVLDWAYNLNERGELKAADGLAINEPLGNIYRNS